MADIHNPEIRSYNMSQVGSKNTKPELIVRSFLHSNGFRYSLHKKELPGSPDIVLRKYNTVIFVHGCFWHGHDCKEGGIPKTNTDFWKEKIRRNKERDRKNIEKLEELGWEVIEVWSCNLKGDEREKNLKEIANKIESNLVS